MHEELRGLGERLRHETEIIRGMELNKNIDLECGGTTFD